MSKAETTLPLGWGNMVQVIRPEDEREGLISYISDTFKAIYGIRPRWMPFGKMSLEELRLEADTLVQHIRKEEEENAKERAAYEAAKAHPQGIAWVDDDGQPHGYIPELPRSATMAEALRAAANSDN